MTRDAAVRVPVVEPMLATAGPLPTNLDGWALEVKWDGARAGSYLDRAGGLRLLTRNGNSATERFPELAELSELLPGRAAVLDGEIIATDEYGRPSVARLQERLALRRPETVATAARTRPVTLMVFDVPWLDGRSLASMSYRGRREVLEALPLDGTRVVVPPAWPGSSAAEALAWTDAQGLEGVIAKRLTSPYTPGERSKNWIKYKHLRTADVWIGGWTLTGKSVKALLLGVPDAAGLRYVGRVGTGFTDAERRTLAGLLGHLAADASPFTGAGPERSEPVQWVRPDLHGEVEYLAYTPDMKLRHPVWRGLRGSAGE